MRHKIAHRGRAWVGSEGGVLAVDQRQMAATTKLTRQINGSVVPPIRARRPMRAGSRNAG